MQMEWRMIKGDVPDMALILGSNEAIYESVRDDLSKPTVSVTRCRKRAVSFGRFQTAKAEVDVEKCRELGIEVVRRQDVCKDEDCGTVFHDHDCEVMYSVVAPESLFPTDPVEKSKVVCDWIIRGLKKINVDAQFRAPNDIFVGSRKIARNAHMVSEGVFLAFGIIFYKPELKTSLEVIKGDRKTLSNDKAIGVAELAEISIDRFEDLLLESLMHGEKGSVETGLFGDEEKRAQSIAQSRYRSDEWNFRR